MERPKLGQFEALTKENFEDAAKRLGRLNWEEKYDEALPLADRVFEFRSEHGDRDAALVNYASNYYSAASRLWKEKKVKAAGNVGMYMNKALRALQERIKREMEKQGGRKAGLIPVSLNGMTSSELDVMQTVYRRAAEVADSMPLVKPLRGLLVFKKNDPIRDFDAAALTAIRAGLKKVREERNAGQDVAPHTEIFLLAGAFDIAKRYGKEKASDTYSTKMSKLAEKYPWPTENTSAEEISKNMGKYGQAARVARCLRDISRRKGDIPKSQEFAQKAEVYAAYIPDQKAKL
ncbi:MAG: hypothetical protein HYT98_00820 [Candidatus Sungbacteria bacterium]|nr:hypothetical protein [Candidatus Sungbacteria bacterium]